MRKETEWGSGRDWGGGRGSLGGLRGDRKRLRWEGLRGLKGRHGKAGGRS